MILKLQQRGAVKNYYQDLSGRENLGTIFGFLILPKAHSNHLCQLKLQTVTLLTIVLFDLDTALQNIAFSFTAKWMWLEGGNGTIEVGHGTLCGTICVEETSKTGKAAGVCIF